MKWKVNQLTNEEILILKDVKYSDESSTSKYTLWENINDDGEKETGLSDNNSFLHDNVD